MSTEYIEFLKQRESIIEKISQLNGSSQVKLTDDEQKASAALEVLKNEVHNDSGINLLSSLYDNFPLFKKTRLYDTLRQMPKGVLQHTHLPAAISLKGFLKAFTYNDKVYYSKEESLFKLFKDGNPDPGYSKIVQLREDEGEEAVVKLMKDMLFFSAADMYDYNPEKIFSHFDQRFINMGDVFYYEPVLRTFMDEVLQEFIDDNFDGVEIRNVCGFFVNESQEKASFDEEIAFFKEFKDKYKGAESPLLVGYIHTGVKTKGLLSEDLNRWFEFYRQALQKQPNDEVFIGFDMVSFEGKTPIKDMAEEFFRMKNENPGTNFILHAGECCAKSIGNVIDAVLLGSKRIGHGLAVDKSTVLIDLVKNHDVCIETNPISNFMLANVRDPFNHPLRLFINSGVACTINSDDCLFWDCTPGSMDYFVATVFADLTLAELKWLVLNTIQYSYFNENDKQFLRERFDQKWGKFIALLSASAQPPENAQALNVISEADS